MSKDEAARIERRIRKADRRLARGHDERLEKSGRVSEHAIRARLLRQLERKI